MCGIAGIASTAALDLTPVGAVMRELLHHRGPDSGGEHAAPHVVLTLGRTTIRGRQVNAEIARGR